MTGRYVLGEDGAWYRLPEPAYVDWDEVLVRLLDARQRPRSRPARDVLGDVARTLTRTR